MRKVRQSRAVAAGLLSAEEEPNLKGYFPNYEPCLDSYVTKYLNRKDVQVRIENGSGEEGERGGRSC